MKHVVQSVIAACVIASASPAAAQIINSSFEEGTFGDGSVREVSRGDTALSGWTVNDNPIAWYANGYEPNPLTPIGVGPHSGNLAVNLCDGSVANQCDGSVRPVSISQTFTVLPFIEQQVSFWVGNYRGNGGVVSIGVTIRTGHRTRFCWVKPRRPRRPISIRLGKSLLILSFPPGARTSSVFRRSAAATTPVWTTSASPRSPSRPPGLLRCLALQA